MFEKLIQRLEVFLLPEIKVSSLVYTPTLKYKRIDTPILYTLEIDDETYLNDYELVNNYRQDLQLNLCYIGEQDYNFDISTINRDFSLSKDLKQQGKLIEVLANLTEDINLRVTKKGAIKSLNHSAVLKKWENIKTQLLQIYKGTQARGYIDGIDTKIRDEALFLDDIRQVKLFGLLFNKYQAAHETDPPRFCKVSNLINCIPVTFKEIIRETKEDSEKDEKLILISGTMEGLEDDVEDRIRKYFTHVGVQYTPIVLSQYKRTVTLDLSSGYPKSVTLDIELKNDDGYIRKQNFNLKQKHDG
ncbi:MAG: hypothetical protein ACK5IQ_03930 [Bacteroidales bacterium]